MRVEDALERAMALVNKGMADAEQPSWVMIDQTFFWFCEECRTPFEVIMAEGRPVGKLVCECGWSKDFEEDNHER